MQRLVTVSILLLALTSFATPQVNVTTYHNDNARTGQNTAETVLTPSLLTSGGFGRLFSQKVDGQIYAQPLLVSGVTIGGVKHNVVYVATEHASVYAFDATSNKGANADPLWKVSFIDPAVGITTVSMTTDLDCADLLPEVGITGTPVIEPVSGTMYLVVKTKENGNFFQRLHALDIRTGAEKLGGPVVIQATVAGSGAGSSNGAISFDPLHHNQRSALLLQNGVVYIAWAAHCDIDPYHGWVMAYDARNLQQLAAWNSTPNGTRGGIWQGGAGLSGDGFAVYFATGNGSADFMHDTGDSVIKMGLYRSHNQLVLLDAFTAFNQRVLDEGDTDLGSGGVLLLPSLSGGVPHPDLAVTAGKEGRIYLLDRTDLGGFHQGGDQIIQELPAAVGGFWGAPAYWNNTVFFGGNGDNVKAFSINADGSGLLSTSPVSRTAQGFSYPGPLISISSDNTANGIVWALETGAWRSGGNAVLHAYDATNLANELWHSQQRPWDVPGKALKFAVPTVANGRVYVGTGTALSVYGQP
jgi:hypothetical protein